MKKDFFISTAWFHGFGLGCWWSELKVYRIYTIALGIVCIYIIIKREAK